MHTCRAVRRGEAAAVIGNIYQGVSAALRATEERAAGEASAGEERPAQRGAVGGMRRSPDFMPVGDADGSRQRSDAGAEYDGAEDAGDEDEIEDKDEDEDGREDANDTGASSLDETWSASSDGIGFSGDEDSEARAAEGGADGGGNGAAARGADGACMQTRRALRSVGKVARKWMATGEFVGWGGLWGVGVGGDGSSSLELQQSVFRAPRDASSLLRRSVNLVGRCVSVERVEGEER